MPESFDRSRERGTANPVERQHLKGAEDEIFQARREAPCAMPPEIRFDPTHYPLPELTITDPGSQRRPADFDDRTHSYRLQNVREHLAARMVEWRGSASPEHYREVREALAEYPTDALLRFARGSGVMEAPGRAQESTHFFADPTSLGTYMDRTNRAQVPETITHRDTRREYRNPEVRQTVGHELGHAMDRFLRTIESPAFLNVVRADMARLSPADRAALAGRRELSNNREIFAELFSIVSNQHSRSLTDRGNAGHTRGDRLLAHRRELNDQILRWFPSTADWIRREYPPNR